MEIPIFGNGNASGNSTPDFREREFPGKFHSQFSETGMQMENSIPNFRERELEAGIPENGREWEFPPTPDGASSLYYY